MGSPETTFIYLELRQRVLNNHRPTTVIVMLLM